MPSKTHIDSDFSIKLELDSKSDDPVLILANASKIIQSVHAIDTSLIMAINGTWKPVYQLDNVEYSSFLSWLKCFLEIPDDDILATGETNKIVGAYLVHYRKKIVELLAKKIESGKELAHITKEINEAANNTFPEKTRVYRHVTKSTIIHRVAELSININELKEGQKAFYTAKEETLEISSSHIYSDKELDELLEYETKIIENDESLVVKKADFLGNSKWDFKWKGRPISAPISDKDWLDKFHHREHAIMPGDTLEVTLRSTIKTDVNKKEKDASFEILKVHDIKEMDSDRLLSLFDD